MKQKIVLGGRIAIQILKWDIKLKCVKRNTRYEMVAKYISLRQCWPYIVKKAVYTTEKVS